MEGYATYDGILPEPTKEDKFKMAVIHTGNTGDLITLPGDIDRVTCGNIMADVAGFFIDRGEDIKGIIILNERRRLNV